MLGNAPWQTLTKARTAVRALNSNMTEDITVYLRQGIYPLSAAFALDASDSGTNGFRVIWKAYPGERPHLSGGQLLTGWTAVGTLRFCQLWVNGVKGIRARSPNAGSYDTLTGWDTGGSGGRLRWARSVTGRT